MRQKCRNCFDLTEFFLNGQNSVSSRIFFFSLSVMIGSLVSIPRGPYCTRLLSRYIISKYKWVKNGNKGYYTLNLESVLGEVLFVLRCQIEVLLKFFWFSCKMVLSSQWDHLGNKTQTFLWPAEMAYCCSIFFFLRCSWPFLVCYPHPRILTSVCWHLRKQFWL